MGKRNAAVRIAIAMVALLFSSALPAGATDLVGQTSANLVWTPASGAVAGYGVFVSKNGGAYGATATLTAATPAITVSGAYGDTLLVKVAAYDTTGTYGPFSPESDPIHFVQAAPAVISLGTASLTASALQGQSPASQTFTVANSGGGTLNYSISDDQGWLSVSPATGTSTGELDTITVSYATTGLAPGTYTATITVAGGAGIASRTIGVTLTISAQPTPAMTLSTNALTASVTQGQSPASQSFTIQNSGSGGTLSYAFSENASWLSVAPASGTSTGEIDTITVSFSTASLAAGTYNAAITASATGVPSQTISVTLTVAAAPTPAMSLSASSLAVSVSQGNDAASQSFTIRNSGTGGTLSYAFSENASWLAVAPVSGTSTGETDTIAVSFSTASLAAGTYNATITASATGVASQTIAVTLTVSSGSPVIEVSPTSIAATGVAGIDAPSVTFTVRNAGGGTLSWAVSDFVSWMSQSPASGTSTGEADTVTVSFQSATRSAGTYTSTITITAPGATSVSVPVTLTINQPAPPVIQTSLTALTPSVTLGGNAASQSFTVRNSGGGALDWAVSENASWLSLSPASGTSTGEADTVTVSYATSGLAAGTYTTQITVSGTGASNVMIDVTLTVGGAPSLVLSTASLGVSATAGQNAASQSFTVRNGGAGSLAWSASDAASWLSLSPATGTSNGEADSVTASFASSGLAAGTYTTTITVSGTGVASKAIAVTLTVASAPPPPPPSTPSIGLSTAALAPTGKVGSPIGSLGFNVRNAGTGALSWSVSDDVGWMSLSPASGTSTGENDAVGVSFSTAGLRVGTYTGTITVAGTGVASKTIAVTLTLTGSGERYDFDGDGAPELLWSHATAGSVRLWTVTGSGVGGSTAAPAAPVGWTVVGVDDFDGDGHADILFRTTTARQYSLWRMNGATRLSQATLTAPAGHEATAVGDFDGDGKADVLWLNATQDDLVVTLLDGSTNVASAPSNSWAIGGGWVPLGTADLNGDGRDDVLWRDPNGSIAVWFMAGAGFSGGAMIATVDAHWFVSGAADFDGDGMADLLLRNRNSGEVVVWYLRSGVIQSGVSLSKSVPKALELEAIGDFDGDHRADVVWRDPSSGLLTLWRLTAQGVVPVSLGTEPDADWQIQYPWSLASPEPPMPSTRSDFDGDARADLFWVNTSSAATRLWQVGSGGSVSTLAGPAATAGWSVVGIADFDGDRKSDVLWRVGTGNQYVLWRMDGATLLGSTTFNAPGGYYAERVGDFDGDGKADVLWRNDDAGKVRLTLLAGGTNPNAATQYTWDMPSTWRAIGAVDLDGDGRDDLLWREDAGTLAAWLMNGTTITKGAVLMNVDPSWVIAGAGDFDGDGNGDLLWRDTVNGTMAMWLMNGVTITKGYYLPTMSNAATKVVAVGDVDGDGRADVVFRNQTTGQDLLWNLADPSHVKTQTLPSDATAAWSISGGW